MSAPERIELSIHTDYKDGDQWVVDGCGPCWDEDFPDKGARYVRVDVHEAAITQARREAREEVLLELEALAIAHEARANQAVAADEFEASDLLDRAEALREAAAVIRAQSEVATKPEGDA